MVPIVSLMVLWALATVSTVQGAWTLRQLTDINANLAGPVGELVEGLQAERAAAARHLAQPAGSGQRDALDQRRAQTDAAMRAVRTGVDMTSSDIASLAPQVNERIEVVTRDVAQLQGHRAAVVAGGKDWQEAYDDYTAAIEDTFAVGTALADIQEDPAARVVLPLVRLGEMLARQDAVASAVAVSGTMSEAQYRAFTDARGGQQVIGTNLRPDLDPAEQGAYQRLIDSSSYASLTALQSTLLADGDRRAATTARFAEQWRGAIRAVTRNLDAIQDSASAAANARTEAASESALTRGAVTVILGLLAVLLALLISVQIGRGLVVELVRLRDAALELARRRLPRAMRRLRAGEKIDVDADVPVMPPGDGEIGQVGDALNAVQRSALQAAAERAELLTGVSGVFVTLARRSQSLMHRQLSLLDAMERRTENPDDLEDLFRLDHLAARMRRHAEGLIIMSGAAPGRAWSEPVPLMNVIRAAVAEVEDFHRVEIRRMAEVSVQGSAVADLTHMIAELVENAASFSPPNTIVLLHGEPVGAGFVVEIEDRGLGMRPESMAEANRRIAEAHQLDLFDREQLGFFVVSRLAHRQNITVTLRPSPFGGTTAVLLLPTSILMPFAPAATQVDENRLLARSAAPNQAHEIRQPEPRVPATRVPGTRAPEPREFEPREFEPHDPGAREPEPREPEPREPETRLPRRRPRDADQRETARRDMGRPETVTGTLTWPEYDQPPAAPVGARDPVGTAQSPEFQANDDRPNDEIANDDAGGLPRRKRQANLAPGLRTPEGDDGVAAGAVGTPASPEQARATMSALQQGFTRGRNG